MTWAAIIRAVALVFLVAMFVTDYGFGWWHKDIGPTVYLFVVAIALGVDASWAREVIKKALVGFLGIDRKDL